MLPWYKTLTFKIIILTILLISIITACEIFTQHYKQYEGLCVFITCTTVVLYLFATIGYGMTYDEWTNTVKESYKNSNINDIEHTVYENHIKILQNEMKLTKKVEELEKKVNVLYKEKDLFSL